ncbi:MAG TPA: AEC family transporter, partial [Gaiellaceae bacterium]|nr:AEC family transporter [Gaiellaceae bacterium]
MIALTLTIAASVALGAGAHRRWGEHVEALTRRLLDALLYVALPFITFFVLVRASLDAGAGIGIALAYVGFAVVGVLAWLAATRVLQLGPRAAGTVVIAAIMGNTTYLGLPLIAALLGSEALGPAITFDALVTGPMFFVVAFAIAAAITTRD